MLTHAQNLHAGDFVNLMGCCLLLMPKQKLGGNIVNEILGKKISL